MSYQLARGESIAAGLRRIVAEEIDSACSRLSARNRENRDEAIHEARKSVKKLRGIVRLLMPGMGEAGERENMALRDTGRRLSAFRDAAAIVETVDDLLKTCANDPAAKDLAAVRAVLAGRLNESGKTKDIASAARQVLRELRGFNRRANTWLEGEDGFAMLAPGLRASYRRGRRALARARKGETALNYHELRKRVKEHWYQVRLLESLGGGASAREKRLKEMQEWLGEDHNLVLLRQTLANEPAVFGEGEALAGVDRLIGKYQVNLREKAMAHGKELYASRPGAFMRHMEHLWDAWRIRPRAAKESTVKRTSSAA
jgi:CHAD domain-containing protein